MVETPAIDQKTLLQAFKIVSTAKYMSELYEANIQMVSKYVHATSRGHEVIQAALGMQLKPQDYLSAYYRDDALLLAIGMKPFELMLQLFAKIDDPFSAGRIYYSHPSLKEEDKPKMPYQSSATGMQAIPSTGVAMGIQYKEKLGLAPQSEDPPIVVCSLGDASMTEGEVSEALQIAALKQLPILYIVQDNEWDISAHKTEVRAMDADEYAEGFPGIQASSIDGTDFLDAYLHIQEVIRQIRSERRPFLIHARVPLLSHHTSGVRKEWYRDDLEEHFSKDPYPKIKQLLIAEGFDGSVLDDLEEQIKGQIEKNFKEASESPDPKPEDLYTHEFASTPITEELGDRNPEGAKEVVMVDAALHAIDELMKENEECLLYGQDVGRRLGGVFREAATLAEKYGDERVFNTPIQEAFVIGSTAGMSAVGLKPIVEIQFADYLWPGLNQLFTEVSRSCYISNGKWPVSNIIRVPIGAYNGGGPFHSSSIESVVTSIKGIKVAYPSNGKDLKGLMKAAYYDPNPVVIFEHKGLYWSKVKGTDYAKGIEPASDYVLPLGKGLMVVDATTESKVLIVCYGMGVHWALQAEKNYPGQVSILDLRTLYPLDLDLLYEQVKLHHRCLVLTEEPQDNGFAQSIASRIYQNCFEYLDAPVKVLGSANVPAIPLNLTLEQTYLPSIEQINEEIEYLLQY